MKKESYNVIGVMSGTSLDGVDLARIIFTKEEEQWSFKLFESETISYTEDWVLRLQSAIHYKEEQLQELNEEYTQLLGTIIHDFINRYRLKDIDLVCSHGHTILHQPDKGLTLQIGNLPLLSTLVKENIVCNFRIQDVAMGGQGAPLVPIGDRLLFSNYHYCLNLGGFSNVSFEENGNRIAFDISPVNTILNFYAKQLGFEYDNKGKIARGGKLNEDLLNELNDLEFYAKQYPKSLGYEFVNDTVLLIMEDFVLSIEDKLHTFVEHIAQQIALALSQKDSQLLITGGGAYNDYLIERIQYYLPAMKIVIPDSKTIEYKEALIFGLLGVLKVRNEINVLSSVTGAKKDHSSGILFLKSS